MNKAIWIAKKNELCSLIKQVSDSLGGDDINFLREYAKEIIYHYQDDLNCPLDIFYNLYKTLCRNNKNKKKIVCIKSRQCILCGYFPPFCYYHKTAVCNRR